MITQSQFKIVPDGFAHPECMPKVICAACKENINGACIALGDGKMHPDCLKCKKC